ncbi:type II toxin-antitoxin system RelE/ParE family toxin [uncultured Enterovirga sp.]|uniref:type II toxin-antitoxin system RelE/ParE family toxin n=1 Tax=uncultured Enterovirga sp. TaxID=2026352 RepID=UPI0035C9C992
MIVAFSRRAERDLDRIFDDVLLEASEQTALRLLERIERRALSLDIFPERGARMRHPELEELRLILEPPYLIAYTVADTRVEIVAVLHGSRDIVATLLERG